MTPFRYRKLTWGASKWNGCFSPGLEQVEHHVAVRRSTSLGDQILDVRVGQRVDRVCVRGFEIGHRYR